VRPRTDDPIRESLLAAAAEVFGELGYDRTSVHEIARRAGFTTGAIYGRFSGKAELLLAAIESHTHDELAELFNANAAADMGERASDIIASMGSHLVEETFDTGQGLLLEAFVAARREPDVARMLRQVIEERAGEFSRLIEQAKAAGVLDPDVDTFSVVRFCHAVGLGFLLFGALGLERPASQPWDALIHQLLEAVQPRAAGAIEGPEAAGST
jgi:AcrR family transcriptional regulator